jgi:flagellar basal-body rod modification protein FlgD
MAVAAVSPSATAAQSSAAAQSSSANQSASGAAGSALMTNYDMFLKMLTTQLRVQNPLEPMNAEKFTEQLVQYSSVEQQIQTNQKLEDMLATMVSSAALSLVNYLGKTVEAASDLTQLKNGKATWKIDAAQAAEKANIKVYDANGKIVFDGERDLVKGENTFEWDGKMANGQDAPDGVYQIAVTAADGDGKAIAVTTRVTGVVTGVDTSGSEPFLKINGMSVPLSSLLNITT